MGESKGSRPDQLDIRASAFFKSDARLFVLFILVPKGIGGDGVLAGVALHRVGACQAAAPVHSSVTRHKVLGSRSASPRVCSDWPMVLADRT